MTEAAPRFAAYFKVRHHEMDALGHVNNAVYLHYLEQAAIAHSDALGFTIARLAALGGVFIARRHEIDYLRPATAGDTLQVITWAAEMRGRWPSATTPSTATTRSPAASPATASSRRTSPPPARPGPRPHPLGLGRPGGGPAAPAARRPGRRLPDRAPRRARSGARRPGGGVRVGGRGRGGREASPAVAAFPLGAAAFSATSCSKRPRPGAWSAVSLEDTGTAGRPDERRPARARVLAAARLGYVGLTLRTDVGHAGARRARACRRRKGRDKDFRGSCAARRAVLRLAAAPDPHPGGRAGGLRPRARGPARPDAAPRADRRPASRCARLRRQGRQPRRGRGARDERPPAIMVRHSSSRGSLAAPLGGGAPRST